MLGEPAESLAKALAAHDRAHKDFNGANVCREGSGALIMVGKDDGGVSGGRAINVNNNNGTLPVVELRLRAWRRRSSETALGRSILLPRMRKGTVLSSSMASSPYTHTAVSMTILVVYVGGGGVR